MSRAVDRADRFIEDCRQESLSFLEEGVYKKWTRQLKGDVSKHRFEHILGAIQTAIYLAKVHDVNVDQCKVAAMLHDCAKNKEKEYFSLAVEKGLMNEDGWSDSKVFHAELGSVVAQMIYGVEDRVVLEAIRNHTTGAPDMDKVSKVVYLADMVEEGRDLPHLTKLRELAMEDLDIGVYAAITQTLYYLLDTDASIDLRTVKTRNSLIERITMERLEKAHLE